MRSNTCGPFIINHNHLQLLLQRLIFVLQLIAPNDLAILIRGHFQLGEQRVGVFDYSYKSSVSQMQDWLSFLVVGIGKVQQTTQLVSCFSILPLSFQ